MRAIYQDLMADGTVKCTPVAQLQRRGYFDHRDAKTDAVHRDDFPKFRRWLMHSTHPSTRDFTLVAVFLAFRRSRQKIISLVQQNIGRETHTQLAMDLYLSRVVIVATNPAALRWMTASFEGAYRRGEVRCNQLAEVDARLLPISQSLIPGKRMDANLWWDLLAAQLVRD
jgi:hypothetical protein